MKKSLKFSNLFFTLILLSSQFLLQSCYPVRLISQGSAGISPPQKATIVTYFWGIKERDLVINRCGSKGLANVTIKNNLAFSLVTVVTIGIIAPMKVEYECNKGRAIISSDSTTHTNN